MQPKLRNITNINIVVTLLVLSVYFIINLKKYFLTEDPRGDEHSFLEMYDVFLNQGFYEANVLGNSTLFNLVSSVFYKLGLSPLYSLKCTSMLSGIITMILVYYIGKRILGSYEKNAFIVAFLTACNVTIVVITIFGGINDPLLVLLLIAIIYIATKNEQTLKDYIYIGILFALMLATRKFTVILIPSIAFLLYVALRKQSQLIKKVMALFIACFITIIAFNFPSLKENGSLSFHSKEKKEYQATWGQLQYYSQILLEEGKIVHGNHATWEATDEYLLKNGEDSLPKGIVDGLLFDVKRTTKEFFIDFFSNIKPFTRLLGIIFLLNIGIFLYKLVKRKITIQSFINNPIDSFSLIYILILSLIIISYVEYRWFIPILLILPFVFVKRIYSLTKDTKKQQINNFLILNAQLAAISIMSLPFVIKNYTIIF